METERPYVNDNPPAEEIERRAMAPVLAKLRKDAQQLEVQIAQCKEGLAKLVDVDNAGERAAAIRIVNARLQDLETTLANIQETLARYSH